MAVSFNNFEVLKSRRGQFLDELMESPELKRFFVCAQSKITYEKEEVLLKLRHFE